ncbi:MAG: hypothetical protein AAB650_02130 [Patescibacteria group bacterium]
MVNEKTSTNNAKFIHRKYTPLEARAKGAAVALSDLPLTGLTPLENFP